METMIVKIDGVEFEVPKAAGQAIVKQLAKDDALNEQVDALKKDMAKEKARADSAEEERDKAVAERNDATAPDAISAAVKARVDLVTQAVKVLGDEKADSLDGMSETEIKRAVILKVSPTAKEKIDAIEGDAQAAYIDARFDAAIESQVKDEPKPTTNKGLDRVRVQAALVGDNRTDSEFATVREHAAMVNRTRGTRPLSEPLPNRASMVKN